MEIILDNGEESYDGGEIKSCYQCEWLHRNFASIRYLNLNLSKARALLDVNPFTLDVEVLVPSDASASVSPFYEPPKASGDGLKLYTGGCACGVITLAVKTKPLSEVEIKEDNCSICQRVGHHL
ncbi:hypothetical protein N7520_007269 [Penicillium odoratum]|uniref:uncharacterized protein n=1 Tax=Penicillium odoratum TaxID=1167516 RepID=UPI002547B4C0|nr:uncharacterized protein N7520_007269 [Penicillium odoratum]KAJ5760113.1 hypothetical protein N7520_007269 [Penicillium odoratum]